MFRSLGVIDCRDVTDATGVSAALEDHVRRATNGGQIKSMITIFGARAPREAPRPDPVRVNNHQLIRYAGFEGADGAILGDPHSADFTRHCLEKGWSPRERNAFTPLPWSISIATLNTTP